MISFSIVETKLNENITQHNELLYSIYKLTTFETNMIRLYCSTCIQKRSITVRCYKCISANTHLKKNKNKGVTIFSQASVKTMVLA